MVLLALIIRIVRMERNRLHLVYHLAIATKMNCRQQEVELNGLTGIVQCFECSFETFERLVFH